MCMTLSFIHLLHASQLFMHYLPTIIFCFGSVFVICFTVNAFVTCCVIVVFIYVIMFESLLVFITFVALC